MRRLVVVLAAVFAVVLGLGWTALSPSQAQTIVVYKGACFTSPALTPVPCPATPIPTAPPIAPVKELSVSTGAMGPYSVQSYTIGITSKVACFPVNEPVDVYAMGSEGEAVLQPVTPVPNQPSMDALQIIPDNNGLATLGMEVWTKSIGPGGLAVKAVWPQEGVEKVVQLFAPATPGPTNTPVPGAPTATATSTPAPSGTGVPTATAVPTIPFFVRTCVSPSTIPLGATSAVLYVQTLPGAVCSSLVTFSDGSIAPGAGQQQVVGDTGVAGFNVAIPANVTSLAATATCTYAGQSASSTTTVTLSATPTPGPTATATLPTKSGG